MGDFWKTLINPALIGLGVGGVVATGYALSKTESKKRNAQPFNYMKHIFGAKYGNDKALEKDFAKKLKFDDNFAITNLDKVRNTKFDKLLGDVNNYCETSLVKNNNRKIFNKGRDRIHYLEFVQ